MVRGYIIVLRGASGSGKTTLARELYNEVDGNLVAVAADDYFTVNGEYKFDPRKLGDAHKTCIANAERAIYEEYSVVIHNTHIKDWEMDAVRKLAFDYDLPIMFVTLKKQYENIHGVPDIKVQQMIENLKQTTITIPKGFTTVDSYHSSDYDAVLCMSNDVK